MRTVVVGHGHRAVTGSTAAGLLTDARRTRLFVNRRRALGATEEEIARLTKHADELVDGALVAEGYIGPDPGGYPVPVTS